MPGLSFFVRRFTWLINSVFGTRSINDITSISNTMIFMCLLNKRQCFNFAIK
ncbi:hypothetical protein BN1221_02746 [Brenneria goodwinii]|uniref:Uncharacterized protein n=1 Tax=Brenneria goodwinii TaxID=1109412 RepID=A0A0G4JWI4_9GAMM|nr:hypothetical protein BN1221_02746 [Brenneria goodwinii]